MDAHERSSRLLGNDVWNIELNSWLKVQLQEGDVFIDEMGSDKRDHMQSMLSKENLL